MDAADNNDGESLTTCPSEETTMLPWPVAAGFPADDDDGDHPKLFFTPQTWRPRRRPATPSAPGSPAGGSRSSRARPASCRKARSLSQRRGLCTASSSSAAGRRRGTSSATLPPGPSCRCPTPECRGGCRAGVRPRHLLQPRMLRLGLQRGGRRVQGRAPVLPLRPRPRRGGHEL
jgi:hypothetical protein